MSIITKVLKQTAVYWAPSGTNAYGQPTYSAPVEIAVRWDDMSEEFLGPDGDRELSRAKVMVASDVELRGVLMLGDLGSSVDQDDPKANEGAWEIRMFKKIGTIKQTEYFRQAFL
jgi:hypothetical protein